MSSASPARPGLAACHTPLQKGFCVAVSSPHCGYDAFWLLRVLLEHAALLLPTRWAQLGPDVEQKRWSLSTVAPPHLFHLSANYLHDPKPVYKDARNAEPTFLTILFVLLSHSHIRTLTLLSIRQLTLFFQ